MGASVPWPFPWPEHDDPYSTCGPEREVMFELDGHPLVVSPTGDEGVHTGRRRFWVRCDSCEVTIHSGTTSPASMIRSHLRSSRAAPPGRSVPLADPGETVDVVSRGGVLRVGSGTMIGRHPISVRPVGSGEPGGGSYQRIRISQVVELSCEVLVPRNEGCVLCGTVAPLPDAAGAEHILANHDGGRICFPREEGVRDERDQYPVTGWIRDVEGIICPECAARLDSFRASMRRGA